VDKIAITGFGIVAPSGIGRRQFWANIKAGRSFVKKVTRFDSSKYQTQIAGQIDDLEKYSTFSERLLKKIDTFSHMALIGSEMAMQDAGIAIKEEDLNRVGIFMGNAIGGWLYAETELRDLYLEGREGVSPYMASAWFPAAPQGQVSIYYGIKGFSKTVVSDRASSLDAIGYARKTLLKNKLNMILAGGTEAPVSPYGFLCCNTYGCLSTNNADPRGAYRPFDKKRSGFVVGEGAGIMVMEPVARAQARGKTPIGFISGYGTTCDGVSRLDPDPSGDQLCRAITIALEDAGLSARDIDYVSLDGLAVDIWDTSEVAGLKKALGKHLEKIPVSCPKSMFGNLLGASSAVDVIITLLAMENNLIPPTINLEVPDPNGLNYVIGEAQEFTVNKALVIARGRGGINSVLVIEK